MLFVLTGPESTAKSTLAATLAEHFSVPWVAEFAREYLQERPQYTVSDLAAIAAGQQQMEREVAGQFAFADTDLQVLYIWWQEKFGPVPHWLRRAYDTQGPRHYLLCAPDIAWEEDPLRENPEDRERLFSIYKSDLEARGLVYSEIAGSGRERVACAVAAVVKAIGA